METVVFAVLFLGAIAISGRVTNRYLRNKGADVTREVWVLISTGLSLLGMVVLGWWDEAGWTVVAVTISASVVMVGFGLGALAAKALKA